MNEDEMKRTFALFDKDGDGLISPTEVRGILEQLGDSMTEEELAEVIKEADQNGDGLINFEEFVAALS